MFSNLSHAYPSTRDISWAAWLKHFAGQLPIYADRYQVSPADVTRTQSTAGRFSSGLVHRLNQATSSFTQASTALAGTPAPDSEPDRGAEFFALLRVLVLARYLQQHSAYTTADGQVLGLLQAPPIVYQKGGTNARLWVSAVGPASVPVLTWRNRRGTTRELQVCRDGHTWQPLTLTLPSSYVDCHPQPIHPTQWQYRARHCHCVGWFTGKWGRVVHLEVGGHNAEQD